MGARCKQAACVAGRGGKLAIVRSGFEKDVGKQRRVQPVMEGVNDLGDGTTLSFHPQAFKDQGSHMLQMLEV